MARRKTNSTSAVPPAAECSPDATAAPPAVASYFAPEDDLPLPLDRQLCFALYSASNLIVRRYRPLLTKLGLTYPQYLVMLALWQQSPTTVGELGRQLDLDFGSITPLLQRMETSGLVRRRRDRADERRVIVELTNEGAALRGRAGGLGVKALCDVPMALGDLLDLRRRLGELILAMKPTDR